MADPVYDSSLRAAVRGDADILQLAFSPFTTPTFVEIPLVGELGGYAPQVTVNRKKAYKGSGTSRVSAVALSVDPGPIDFTTLAKSTNTVFISLMNNISKDVLFKANYASIGVTVQGQGILKDRGIQGGSEDVPEWGFSVEPERVDPYVLAS